MDFLPLETYKAPSPMKIGDPSNAFFKYNTFHRGFLYMVRRPCDNRKAFKSLKIYLRVSMS